MGHYENDCNIDHKGLNFKSENHMHNVMRFRTKFLSGHWFVEIILPGLNLYQIYFIVLNFHDVIFIMQLARNYAETALFHKISTPGN